ncbi:MAG: hypothetical protein AVDCRST_MAG77-1361 [uncultured Chloroflexi bacterium]|uniref:Uncharacterized protein n=1 Tax=uncultured Chloroflexota bacterium TaxID=166587 RepID=A0A6J4I0S4_9CHLR|nr:MAG: hypothetical protein AVDCRST_MAG77-1361 [uncultured Chloroflexota bacterium]
MGTLKVRLGRIEVQHHAHWRQEATRLGASLLAGFTDDELHAVLAPVWRLDVDDAAPDDAKVEAVLEDRRTRRGWSAAEHAASDKWVQLVTDHTTGIEALPEEAWPAFLDGMADEMERRCGFGRTRAAA